MSTANITKALVDTLCREGLLKGEPRDWWPLAGERGEGLVSSGVLAEEQRLKVIARLLHLDYVELTEGFHIPQSLMERLGAETIREYSLVPMDLQEGVLQVAVSYPYPSHLEDTLHKTTGLPIGLSLCDRGKILRVLHQNRLNAEVVKAVSATLDDEQGEGEVAPASVHDLNDDQGDPVVRLLNQVCRDAIGRRSSDIHVESSKEGINVRYRCDGVLISSGLAVPPRHSSQFVSRIKVMSGLDIAERQLPQDGRFRLQDGSRELDVRVSILPSSYGEDAVLRLLDQQSVSSSALSLDALGFSEAPLDRFRSAILEPYGLVLLTGPTGSGKTTTLYAAIQECSSAMDKTVTIEDPVEYQLPGIVQVPVNEKKGLTFARGLRSILRHDPDKIMVGEIRDSETAEMAVQAAMTGHLVFSTVHANTTVDVISRLRHMGVEPYTLISSVKCVLGQRLLRRVCDRCVTYSQTDSTDKEVFGAAGLSVPAEVPKATGCAECDSSGYRGRFAVSEFIYLTPELKRCFLEQKAPDEISSALTDQGFESLRLDALKQVLAGKTTLEEVRRVTQGDYQQ